jgi:vancomycin resistance protein YoaR
MPTARRAGLWSAGGLAALGVAYAAAVLLTGDDLPRGTRIAGQDVGGLSPAAAAQRLTADSETGVRVDPESSVDSAHASRWAPQSLWAHAAGGGDHDAVVVVDDEQLAAYVETLPGTEPKDGAVHLTRHGVQVTQPRDGTRVGEDEARKALVEAARTGTEADLEPTTSKPAIDEQDVEQGRQWAEQALSAPVVLSFQDATVELPPAKFARALRLAPQDGELVPTLRPKVLEQQLAGLVAQEPVDATVRLTKQGPEVVEAKPGVTYDAQQVEDAFLDLVQSQTRTLELGEQAQEPSITTADAEAWQIDEKISEFTTYFPYAEYRNTNIGRAAELVDQTVVPPGGSFSLNDTVGERTAENGFTDGFIISNGIFKEDLGGGVSQMATTVFNAAFFGGMTDVEHKPHSFYIDRYPVGREATVAWPVVDLRWRNDTPYGVLVHATVKPSTPSSQGVVTVQLWSTKYWDITTKTSERYNPTAPKTRRLDTADCYPNTGYAGFDVDVWRYWHRAGDDEVVRTEKMHTTYTPSDTVICTPPKQD